MALKVEAFKIRFPNQKYSGGKSEPQQAPRGKVWSSKQALSSHITLVTETWFNLNSPNLGQHPYKDAVVLDLVQGTEYPLDWRASAERLAAKLQDPLRYWNSESHKAKVKALNDFLAASRSSSN